MAAKHAVALQGNVHEVIFPGEWPAAIEGENPKAVEVFDDSVWVFLKRKTGDVAEGFVYCQAGEPKTFGTHCQKTRAPHLYYFTWRP
ncbi:MAG: hypothetical protein PW734_09810 [Verrucomicrobium sp.]|nr:hypothetical protein [Verrucomicrobium sp.]